MAGICGLPVVGAVCSTVGAGVQSGFQQILDWMTSGLGQVVALMTSGWLKVSTPGVEPLPGSGVNASSSVNGATDTAAWLQSHTLWLSSWLAAVCLVLAGARMAYQMRGLADLRVVLEGLIRLVLVNGIVITGVYVATQIGDSYSNWIINESLGAGAAQKLGAVTGSVSALSAGMGLIVPMVLVGAALISSLLNLVMGFFRAAILVVLSGTIGIPAASALTDMGRRWLARWLAWMSAFICIKPAAATVYAAAYRLTGSGDGKDMTSAISGLALLAGAVVVLPALLRLFQPAGMALAGGSGLTGPDSGGGSSRATGSAAPSGAASSGGQASGSSGSSSPSGAASSGGGGKAGLTSGQSSGVSSAARTGAASGAASSASSGSSSGGKSGGAGGEVGGKESSGVLAGAAMTAGRMAKQQVVDGLRESAQGLDHELGDGPSGS